MVEVSPQYIVINLSSQDIYFSQAHIQLDIQSELVMALQPKDRQPFHWPQKNMPKQVKFKIHGAVRTTASFTLADCGSLAVTNVTESGEKIFFRVTKRIVLNSNFIIVEDMEHAPYKIDNLCSDVYLSYFQAGGKSVDDIETCPPEEDRPFAWRDVIDGTSFMLNVQFFVKQSGNEDSSEVLVPVKAQDQKRPETLEYSLDVLNRTAEVGLCNSEMEKRTVYVSTYTNEFQKVFEISDEPSKHIFETEKDKNKNNENEKNE